MALLRSQILLQDNDVNSLSTQVHIKLAYSNLKKYIYIYIFSYFNAADCILVFSYIILKHFVNICL